MSAPTILVIEDDPGLNLLLQHRLSRSGLDVLSAVSGSAGIELALSAQPTLFGPEV